MTVHPPFEGPNNSGAAGQPLNIPWELAAGLPRSQYTLGGSRRVSPQYTLEVSSRVTSQYILGGSSRVTPQYTMGVSRRVTPQYTI